MENDQTCINPLEDQRKQALQHYEEASRAIHHWSSFVQRAIETYNPNPIDNSDDKELASIIIRGLGQAEETIRELKQHYYLIKKK